SAEQHKQLISFTPFGKLGLNGYPYPPLAARRDASRWSPAGSSGRLQSSGYPPLTRTMISGFPAHYRAVDVGWAAGREPQPLPHRDYTAVIARGPVTAAIVQSSSASPLWRKGPTIEMIAPTAATMAATITIILACLTIRE